MLKDQSINKEFAYDQIAYPSFIIPQTHPDLLRSVAKLHGMAPAPADDCRILELGCAGGTNLNWLASNLPNSELIGVDLGTSHITEARKNAADLELKNVSFYRQDVLEITKETFGKFDYIIAHGLFSWVPEVVREKILSLYDELLNPHGVGFVSYNVFPGCYRRRIVSDMMRFHTRNLQDPVEKVRQGAAFIDFITEQTRESPAYHELLKYELEGFTKRSLENIYHDDFADFNQPFYFTEFIAEAEKHDLKFLSECDYLPSQRNNIPQAIAQVFDDLSQSTIELEQYSDFLECRRFRQTLLCRKEVELALEISPEKINQFYISSLLKPTSPTLDLNPDSAKEFVSNNGDTVKIGHVLTKVVLVNLVTIGSHPVGFSSLISGAADILRDQGFVYDDLEKETAITAAILLQLYSPNAIRFHSGGSAASDQVSDKPLANKFARWQSKRDNMIANVYGDGLNIEDGIIRDLVSLLDGTRTRENLNAELGEMIRSGHKITDQEVFLAGIPEMIDRDLFILAKMGFLIG